MTRAVFLDRDGTLNVETGYVHRADEWEWVPGAIEALRLLNAAGYLAIVVTNQAGIARGLYGETELEALHAHVTADAQKHGVRIDAFYHCPHHPQFGEVRECDCRKPAPGLLLRAQRDFAVDLTRSFMIGDKPGDIAAGRAAGVTALLVETGYGREARAELGADVPVFPDVLAAVRFVTG